MFFNESFLLKQKALAHIWLASNMEKKLKRHNYLSADLTEAVDQIKNEREGPQSLRTSGQLLFGVSTIYKRKAMYLKEDCDSTLQSLRTFKPGDVDSAPAATTAARESALTLDNQITELNFASLMPEFPQFAFEEAPLTQIPEEPFGAQADESIELGRAADEDNYVGDDEDLGIDFGGDMGVEVGDTSVEVGDFGGEVGDMSIEVGREAMPPRALGDDLAVEAGKDIGEDSLLGAAEDIEVPEMEPLDIEMPSSPDLNPATPMADAEVEVAVAQEEDGIEAPITARKTKRAKMATQFDTQSTLRASEGAVERVEHPRLPSNYYDFMMYELGRNTSDFVAAMYRPAVIGLPPAVADRMFNPQTVRETMQRQERPEEEAEAEEEERASKQPRIEEEAVAGDVEFEDAGGFEPILSDNEGMEEPVAESPVEQPFEIEHEEPVIFAALDEDSTLGTGISQNTLQAARILRTEMPEAEDKSSFEVLVARANKPDKVKMFFELLVLATKDAVAINQEEPFGDIDVATKDSLYRAPLAV